MSARDDEWVKAAADRAEGIKPDAPQHPGGRPPKYKSTFAAQAAKLCALGATNADLADFFEVAISTISAWLVQHQEFSEAVKEAKETADARVQRSLYQRAVGYTFESEKIQIQRDGEIIRAPTREHCAPDVTAQIFWLKNRRPEEWREKVTTELTGKDGAPIEVTRIERIIVRPQDTNA